jgi:hypothetical protein
MSFKREEERRERERRRGERFHEHSLPKIAEEREKSIQIKSYYSAVINNKVTVKTI